MGTASRCSRATSASARSWGDGELDTVEQAPGHRVASLVDRAEDVQGVGVGVVDRRPRTVRLVEPAGAVRVVGHEIPQCGSASSRRRVWPGTGPGWDRCSAYREPGPRTRSRGGRRRRRRAGCGTADSDSMSPDDPALGRGERGALRAVQRRVRQVGVVVGLWHRLGAAGVLDDPPALALGGDDEPREDCARVWNGVGVMDQTEPRRLHDVLGLVVADRWARTVCQSRQGQQLDRSARRWRSPAWYAAKAAADGWPVSP